MMAIYGEIFVKTNHLEQCLLHINLLTFHNNPIGKLLLFILLLQKLRHTKTANLLKIT